MVDRRPTRKLATIMFSDMVGYSALVGRDERLAFRLLEQHRRLVRATLPRYGGREVDTIGDAFLVEFDSALLAAQCAIAIHQALAVLPPKQPGDPRVVLRIALHLGDIERPGGQIYGDIYGDTVNIAARLQELAPRGGIALSAPVLHQIEQRIVLPYHSLGRPALKNITHPPEVFTVDAEAILAAPSQDDAATLGAGAEPPRRRWLLPLAAAALVLVSGAAGLAASYLRGPAGTAAPSTQAVPLDTTSAATPAADSAAGTVDGAAAGDERDGRSVAVLPFENRSADADNAFFADGVQDEIVTRLAKVAALKVVSRASTQSYGPKPADLALVASELGVSNLLHGSVQRAGALVRVNVQLIDARTRGVRWAETYDRRLADSLTVQNEVATAIARALDAKLTPAEAIALQEIPTTDPKAYDAYLRGRAYQTRAEISPEKFRGAIRHYRDAVRLDPEFALAWARLAFVHGALYRFDYDHTPERRAQAERAAREAVRLQPELGESFLALGHVLYFADRKYDEALQAFEEARRRLPNDPDALMAISYVKRRQGRIDEAIVLQREAASRDPRNTSLLQQFAISLILTRKGFGEADGVLARALKIAPQDSSLLAAQVSIAQARGDLARAAAVLRDAPKKPDDWFLFNTRVEQWLYERDYRTAIDELESALASAPPDRGATIGPYYVQLAIARRRAGDAAGAQASAQRGIDLVEKLRRDGFDTPLVAASLAQLRAELGDSDGARREATLAERGFANDAVFGPYAHEVRARVEAALGHADAAIPELEHLLVTVYSSNQYLTPMTPALLRLDPAWDRLRGNPRFDRLLTPDPA